MFEQRIHNSTIEIVIVNHFFLFMKEEEFMIPNHFWFEILWIFPDCNI